MPDGLPQRTRAPLDPPREPRRSSTLLEVTTVSLLWIAAIIAGLGAIAVGILPDRFGQSGRLAESFALLMAIGAVAAASRLTTLRHLRAGSTGGRAYDLMQGQRRLRFVSAFVQLMQIAAALLVALRAAEAVGLVDVGLAASVMGNIVRGLLTTLAIACAAGLAQSLRTPLERDRRPLSLVLGWLALGLALGIALLGTAAALERTAFIEAWVRVDLTDTGILVLAGYVALAFGLVRMRSLPTLTWLFFEEDADQGRVLGSRRAATVLVPAILAFALMLVVFLLFLLFGLGVTDFITAVGGSPLLLGVMAFIFVALLASLGTAFALARGARGDTVLYKVLPDREVRRIRALVTGSAILAGAFGVAAALSFVGILPDALWLHALCLALLTGLGPYGFYAARQHKRTRLLEERFPDFLRDIASSHKGGLTLHQAASIAARGEYGELTPDVRKMADQLSWNVSFSEALERFAERVHTPLVQRAVSLILQADRSGGSTTDVLLAAAKDAREIKNLENERRQTMGLYTVVVYITFFVFLATAAILYSQFAPQIVAASQGVGSLADANVQGLGGTALRLEQYQMFYFLAAVVQGVGDGIVAGLLGSGRAVLGLRHGFAMVLVSYILFAFLL